MVRHWVIRLVSANLITCWAFQASFGEESVLAEKYDAARSTTQRRSVNIKLSIPIPLRRNFSDARVS